MRRLLPILLVLACSPGGPDHDSGTDAGNPNMKISNGRNVRLAFPGFDPTDQTPVRKFEVCASHAIPIDPTGNLPATAQEMERIGVPLITQKFTLRPNRETGIDIINITYPQIVAIALVMLPGYETKECPFFRVAVENENGYFETKAAMVPFTFWSSTPITLMNKNDLLLVLNRFVMSLEEVNSAAQLNQAVKEPVSAILK